MVKKIGQLMMFELFQFFIKLISRELSATDQMFDTGLVVISIVCFISHLFLIMKISFSDIFERYEFVPIKNYLCNKNSL